MVDQRGADAGNLVRTDRGADTTAAHGDTALDLSNLAFSFNVEETSLNAAAYTATFTIYNLAPDMVQRFEKELTVVYFEAGYRKPAHQYGKLFTGPITYFRHGRQSATDTFVEIHAMSQAEQPFNRAVVNTTLPAGHTQKDVLNALMVVLAPYGINLGQVTDLGSAQSPRGRVCYGNVSDVLRDLAQTSNANAFTDRDSKLHVLKEDEALDMHSDAIPVLNSKTGMIGIPTVTTAVCSGSTLRDTTVCKAITRLAAVTSGSAARCGRARISTKRSNARAIRLRSGLPSPGPYE